ncbi:TipAS antibiotic-recognition domain-containing protein [Candidatus Acetothermia bacterium]|nr:TipAS antibiotic-recognition domain-containing protein [Candidatus Acetothermia bacterium]
MTAFQRLQKQGRKPSDPQVQKLAAQMEELIHEFTQGDEGIRQSLNRAYRNLGKLPKEQRPLDLELQRYMSEACRIHNEKKKVSKR